MKNCSINGCNGIAHCKDMCSYHYRHHLYECGIYLIRNIASGKVYVGSSVNIRQRWRKHRHLLNLKKHWNKHLQSSWDKYGKDVFEFTIIEFCPAEVLTVRELVWIEYHDAMNNSRGYNHGFPDRHIVTEETRKRMSEVKMGRVVPETTKRKMSIIMMGKNKGKIHTAEQNKKASEVMMGKCYLTDEGKRKLSNSLRLSWNNGKRRLAQNKRKHSTVREAA